MVLFFGLVFSVAPPPENFSADALGRDCTIHKEKKNGAWSSGLSGQMVKWLN